MISKEVRHSRRLWIKSGLAGVFGLTGLFPIFTGNLMAKEKQATDIKPLIVALRSTHNSVCEAIATRLALFEGNETSYDLHLRHASLGHDEIELITSAIKQVADDGGPLLQSFSLSYHLNLGDQGVLNLVKSLPPGLREIGLVQCGIGDPGGQALIAWASQAPALRMLCVEQNAFSHQTKQALLQLGREKNYLLVVV